MQTAGSGAQNHIDMLKELEALRNKQQKHDAEMEDLRKAQQNTLEVPSAQKDADRDEEDQRV